MPTTLISTRNSFDSFPVYLVKGPRVLVGQNVCSGDLQSPNPLQLANFALAIYNRRIPINYALAIYTRQVPINFINDRYGAMYSKQRPMMSNGAVCSTVSYRLRRRSGTSAILRRTPLGGCPLGGYPLGGCPLGGRPHGVVDPLGGGPLGKHLTDYFEQAIEDRALRSEIALRFGGARCNLQTALRFEDRAAI